MSNDVDAASLVGQHAGIHTEGNLQVLVDIGLGEAVGMSAGELKEAIASWKALKKQVDDELREFKAGKLEVEDQLTKLKNHTDLMDEAGGNEAKSTENKLRDEIKCVKDLKDQVVGLNMRLMDAERNQRDQKDEFERKLQARQVEFAQLEGQFMVTSAEQGQLHQQLREQRGHIEEQDRQLREQRDDLRAQRDVLEKYMEKPEDKDEKQPDTQEEPGIALEDQLRITEQSAKAIDILSNHLLSTVWQTCSKNTFGFFIRIVLLCGSEFKKQLIPETAPLLILAFLGALFSVGMQIVLALFLWTRLPPTFPQTDGNNASLQVYPGTSGMRGYFEWPSGFGFLRPPLPAYEYPNYKFGNDVCRTVPIVQLVTVALFLFSILNNIPDILKNVAIIWTSDRFISVDEDGVTKLHYWRESSGSRASANDFLKFLHKMFKDKLLNKNVVELHKKTSATRKSRQDVEVKACWDDSELSSFLEWLRIEQEQIFSDESNPKDDPDADVSRKALNLAFICEMFLSGAIIHDAKNRNFIQARTNMTFKESGGNDDSVEAKEYKAFAGASRRRLMLKEIFPDILKKKKRRCFLEKEKGNMDGIEPGIRIPEKEKGNTEDIHIPRRFFEVCEARSFLAEALRLMDGANNTKKVGSAKEVPAEQCMLFKMLRDNSSVWPVPIDLKLWPQPIQFCDQVRLNLVRMDYLRPNRWIRNREWAWIQTFNEEEDASELQELKSKLEKLNNESKKLVSRKQVLHTMVSEYHFQQRDAFGRFLILDGVERGDPKAKKREAALKKVEDAFLVLEDECSEKQLALLKTAHSLISESNSRQKTSKQQKSGEFDMLKALRTFLGRDFTDVLTAVSFSKCCESRMVILRIIAFVFGVLPELASLLIMAVAGVQYILWSGFKVDSDTQGMEEIILATLAINFIYEIDEAIYDHVLPELYKEAHERDRFEITGYWISSETSTILSEKCGGAESSSSWCWPTCGFKFNTGQVEAERKREEMKSNDWKMKRNDCLKRMRKCQPVECETDSPHPLLRGFSYDPAVAAVKEETNAAVVAAVKEETNAANVSCQGCLVFQVQAGKRENDGKFQAGHGDKNKGQQENAKTLVDQLKTLLDQRPETATGQQESELRTIIESCANCTKLSEKQGQLCAETAKYEPWASRFDNAINKAIKEEKLCRDDWGDHPFECAMDMSVTDEWNDIYLAHAYPFLYARKLRYAFASHAWERFLIFYGKLGLHLVVLVGISLAIVGGYRSLAQCHRFAPDGDWAGIFARQEWPSTCLLNVGQAHENFTDLEGASAAEFLPVSCGVSGYIPDDTEWARNRDYFGAP